MTAEGGGPASRRELRSFAITVGAAFVALAALLYWRGGGPAAAILGTAGVVLSTFGLIAPGRLGPVHRAWMGLAHAISRVTTPIFMGIVFFGVLTPIALAMRVVGRRPLTRARGAATCWVDRPASERRSDLRRQF